MDFVNKAYTQAAELFRSLSPATRLAAGLLLAVIVVSVAGGERGDGGRETAEAFVREHMTAVDAMLVDAGARR